ncbi:MAG: hypothetical protein IKA48_00855 [Fibrobacter sp.]|nr:hypothetical protein [Fibrobacter sp.]
MKSIRMAIYASIVLHFLRLIRRKVIRPAPKLVMPPAPPGDTTERVTLGAIVRTDDEWAAFMVSGAATATISGSQSDWLHHAMFKASDGLIQELSGKNCEIRLCSWCPENKKPHITPPALARMFGLAGTPEANFTARFDSLVRQFNEAVRR